METIRELLISLGISVEHAEWIEAIGLEHLLEKGAELLVEALEEIPKALAEAVIGTAEYAHQLETASERTGLSTERLQELGFIGKTVGVSMEEMEVSVGHLARTMAGARDGNEEAQKTFAKLGVRVTDANGKLRDADEVMNDMADGIARLPPGMERTNASMAVFGRSGRKMLNVFSGGSEKLKKLTEEFHELGGGMDEEAIAKGAELMQTWTKIQAAAEMLVHEFAGPLVEAIGPVVEEMLEWVKANRKLIGTKVLEVSRAIVAVLKVMGKLLVGIGHAVYFVAQNWKILAAVLTATVLPSLFANIGALAVTVSWYIALGVQAVAAAIASAAAWVAATWPVWALIAALTLLILVIDDVYGYLTGADSLIGDIGPKWTKFLDDLLKPAAGDPWWLAALKEALVFVTDIQGGLEKLEKSFGSGLVSAAIKALNPVSQISAVADAAGAVSGGFSGGAAGPSEAAGGRAAAGAGGATNVKIGDTTNHIEIHTQPGQDAGAIADEVQRKIDAAHHQRTREAIAAVR